MQITVILLLLGSGIQAGQPEIKRPVRGLGESGSARTSRGFEGADTPQVGLHGLKPNLRLSGDSRLKEGERDCVLGIVESPDHDEVIALVHRQAFSDRPGKANDAEALWLPVSNYLMVWGLRTGRLRSVTDLGGGMPPAFTFCEAKRTLAVKHAGENDLRFWNLDTRVVRESWSRTPPFVSPEPSRDEIDCLDFSSQGGVLAQGGTGAFAGVALLDGGTGKDLGRLSRTVPCSTVCIDPTQRFVAAGARDGRIRLWDMQGRRLLHLFEVEMHGLISETRALAFSSDGGLLGSASNDGRVRIWETKTGKLVRTLVPAEGRGAVVSICWNAGGTRLAAGGMRGSVSLWDIRSGAEIARGFADAAHRAEAPVASMVFSRAGDRLFASDSGGIQVFSLSR